MYGLPQTVGTCWFDAVLMMILTPTLCRQIFGPALNRIVSNKIKPEEPEPGLSLESLLDEKRKLILYHKYHLIFYRVLEEKVY